MKNLGYNIKAKIFQIFIVFAIIVCSKVTFSQTEFEIRATDSLKNLISSNVHDTIKVQAINELIPYKVRTQIDSCGLLVELALTLSRKSNYSMGEALSLQNKGMIFFVETKYDSAHTAWQNSLALFQKLKSEKQIANVYKNLSIIYKNWTKFDTAIVYIQRAITYYEKLKDGQGLAESYYTLGSLFYSLGEDKRPKAREYYVMALEEFEKLKLMKNVAMCMNTIGMIYKEDKNPDEALKYHEKALKIFEDTKSVLGRGFTLNYIGSCYTMKKEYQKALKYCEEALDIYQKTNRADQIPYILYELADIYFNTKDFKKSLQYYERCVDIFMVSDAKTELMDSYKRMSEIYEIQKDYPNAFKYYKKHSLIKDSARDENSRKIFEDMQTKYETNKKEQANKLLQKEKQQQQIVIYSFVLGFIVVIVFSFLLWKQMNEKKKANIKLAEQNEEIKRNRDEIHEKKQAIEDSIIYAERIQRAVLPRIESIREVLPNHFIFWRPRDIVSGDFYWLNVRDRKVIIVAADCTGHGVPGAFMSMLGVTFINQIVSRMENLIASDILDSLRDNIIKSLHQTGKEGESKDGMDIALSIIDLDAMEVQFAGAYNPLYIVRNKELIEVKANNMPIGIYFGGLKPFKNNVISLLKGDRLYSFSDGYPDQFGGADGKKYMSKNFKQFLLSIADFPINQHEKLLEQEHKRWRAEVHEQTDDVIVIGVEI